MYALLESVNVLLNEMHVDANEVGQTTRFVRKDAHLVHENINPPTLPHAVRKNIDLVNNSIHLVYNFIHLVNMCVHWCVHLHAS